MVAERTDDASTPPERTGGLTGRLRRGVGGRNMRDVWLPVGNLISQAINMVAGLILARSLGPRGRGIVATVAVYDETATKLVALGVPGAVSFHGARTAGSADADDEEARLLGAALRIAIWSIPAAALIGWVSTAFILRSLPDSIRLLLFVSMSFVPIVAVFPTTCRAVLVSRGQMRRLAVLGPIQTGSRLVGFVALAVFDVFTPLTASVVFLASNLVGHIAAVAIVRTRPRSGGRVGPLLSFGIKATPSTLADLATSRLDQIVLAGIVTQAEFGLYAVAIGVTFLPTMLGLSLGSSAYRDVAAGGPLAAQQTFRRLGVVTGAAGLFTAFAAAVLVEPVYGADFSGSVEPALVLSLGSVATGWYLGLAQVGNANGRPQIGSVAAGVGLVLTVAGLAIVLPAGGGITAAAWVSTVAYSARLLVCWALLVRSRVLPARRAA